MLHCPTVTPAVTLVKTEILQAYAHVLEVYRAKFHALRIKAEPTHVEFVREKRKPFSHCQRSEEVVHFETLKELILRKDFLRTILTKT